VHADSIPINQTINETTSTNCADVFIFCAAA
jgi:hypothetical protein